MSFYFMYDPLKCRQKLQRRVSYCISCSASLCLSLIRVAQHAVLETIEKIYNQNLCIFTTRWHHQIHA